MAKEIAFQIRATRDRNEMTQAELAKAIGMSQNNISRLESPDYGKHTLSSLKRIASALDVALVVRLVPFSQYIDWLSGTPHWDLGLRPEALGVPSFQKEQELHRFDEFIQRPSAYELNTFGVAAPVGFVTSEPIRAKISAHGTLAEAFGIEGSFYSAAFPGVPAQSPKAVA